MTQIRVNEVIVSESCCVERASFDRAQVHILFRLLTPFSLAQFNTHLAAKRFFNYTAHVGLQYFQLSVARNGMCQSLPSASSGVACHACHDAPMPQLPTSTELFCLSLQAYLVLSVQRLHYTQHIHLLSLRSCILKQPESNPYAQNGLTQSQSLYQPTLLTMPIVIP